jgi:hypothetical protein
MTRKKISPSDKLDVILRLAKPNMKRFALVAIDVIYDAMQKDIAKPAGKRRKGGAA